MPLTDDVGQNIKQLRQDNKIKPPKTKRGAKQIQAIAIDAAKRKQLGAGQSRQR